MCYSRLFLPTCISPGESSTLILTNSTASFIYTKLTNCFRLLRYTLEILANTDGNMVYSDLHNSIVQLEQFVLSLPNKTAYPISLLAKVCILIIY